MQLLTASSQPLDTSSSSLSGSSSHATPAPSPTNGSTPIGSYKPLFVSPSPNTPRHLLFLTPSVYAIPAGPLVIASFALARKATTQSGTGHYNDTHKKWGLALFILYWIQLGIGALIHFVKPVSGPRIVRRPVQNYVHALLGLFILGASFYQVTLSAESVHVCGD